MRLIDWQNARWSACAADAGARGIRKKPVAHQGVTVERIAESRTLMSKPKVLTPQAAHRMDTVGNKQAKTEIAMIKVAVPAMAVWIVDWSIQVHGGGGTSNDFGLTRFLCHGTHPSIGRWAG